MKVVKVDVKQKVADILFNLSHVKDIHVYFQSLLVFEDINRVDNLLPKINNKKQDNSNVLYLEDMIVEDQTSKQDI